MSVRQIVQKPLQHQEFFRRPSLDSPSFCHPCTLPFCLSVGLSLLYPDRTADLPYCTRASLFLTSSVTAEEDCPVLGALREELE
eukprot:855820-Rhodomonas_salina.4